MLVAIFGLGSAAYFYFLKGSSKHLQLVPKNAVFVVNADFKSLLSKADMDKVKELDWYKDLQKKMKEETHSEKDKKAMEVFDHPFSSGVNIMSDVYVFGAVYGEAFVSALVFDIKDAGQFKESVMKLNPDAKITDESGFQSFQADRNTLIAWNGTGGLAVMVYDRDMRDSLKGFVKTAFSQSKEESVLGNKFFAEYNKSKKDISVFVNYNEFDKLGAALMRDNPYGSIAYSTMSGYLKGNYTWTNLDFQDNRILISSERRVDEGVEDKSNILKTEGICEDHKNCISNKDVYMLFAIAMDADKFYALFNKIPMIALGEQQLAAGLGMSVSDMEKMFGGEMSFALVDFKKPISQETAMVDDKKKEDDPYGDDYDSWESYHNPMDDYPMPVFTFNFSSNNKAGVESLMAKDMQKNADGYYVYPAEKNININVAENKFGFTVTNSDDIAKTVAKDGKLSAPPARVAELLNGKSSAMFWDLDLEHYPIEVRDNISKSVGERDYNGLAAYMKLFKDVTGSGDTKKSEVSINLTDGSGNSLYRLLAQADVAYKAVK